MEIITRTVARRRDLPMYFTGKPCKNNHIAERYFESGACKECIRESKSTALSPISKAIEGEILSPTTRPIDALKLANAQLALAKAKLALAKATNLNSKSLDYQEEKTSKKEVKERRRIITEELVDTHLKCFPEDYRKVLEIVWVATVMRNPMLKKEDVVKRQLNHCTWTFRCYAEDRKALYAITDEIFGITSSKTYDVQTDRARILAGIETEAEKERAEEYWPNLGPNNPG